MSGKVIFTTGSFLGEMGTTADGELFINSHGKTKGVTLEGVKQYSQSAAGDLIEVDLDPTTGIVIREKIKIRDSGREIIYSGSSAASPTNQIEFIQDNDNALIITSGSNPGLNCLESDTNAYAFYRSKMISFLTASELRTIGIPSGTTTDLLISNNLVQGAGKTGIRYSPQSTAIIQLSGSVEISGSENMTIGGNLTVGGSISGDLSGDSGAVTGITSLYATDITIGEDSQTRLDFGEANKIRWAANNQFQMQLEDGVFRPTSDSDVDLGTTSVRWKDAYIDTITTTGDITASGDLAVGQYIYHNGDTDTFIRLLPDTITIEAGGENMIFVVEGAGGDQADKVTINNDSEDIDFQVKGDTDTNLLRVDAATDMVGIGARNPTTKLQVEGAISASGALYGQVGSGVIVSSSVSDTTLFSVQHPISGSVFEVNATGVGSGSLALSGSLLLNNNDLIPAVSASKLYNKDGTLYWSGDAHIASYPLYPKKRVYYHHNFYDDLGTTTVYLPWSTGFEGSTGMGSSGQLFITDAKLLKVFFSVDDVSGGATITMELSARDGASDTDTAIGTKEFAVDASSDRDVIFVDWEGSLDSGTNTVTAGQLVNINVDSSADVSGNEFYNITSVWELDLSTELTASITS